jgi:hypothetical protein
VIEHIDKQSACMQSLEKIDDCEKLLDIIFEFIVERISGVYWIQALKTIPSEAIASGI